MLATLLSILVLATPSPVLSAPLVELPRPPEISEVATSTPVFVPDDSLRICNCYLEVKKYVPNLPRTKDLIPNSPARPGAVAIYKYSNGLMHYAYVIAVQHEGVYGHWEKGSNLKRCTFYTRFVDEENPYLVGYYYDAP